MKHRWIGLIVPTLAAALQCADVDAAPRPIVLPREDSGTTSARNEKAVLERLRPVLRSAKKAGRIYYVAPCYDRDIDPVPFPRVKPQAVSKGKTDLVAVREIFKNDRKVAVTEDQSGMIRIMIGKVPPDILQTRIASLTLKPIEQYNPEEAIAAITGTKEVADVMRKLGFEEPLIILGLQMVQPEKGLPHLPRSMKGLTVDQAFDLVAKTFSGVVLYGGCAELGKPRLFFVEFVWVI